ncbi:hypothetical protein PR048_025560 [Dryococelus australis]|uniref:Uncharacterized protein n=1 Tax=Dryococelus australis TaxID=614101 RepID=A0ABQ9GRT7_9NEOP|nr:hypothetical protein PR048_025560 [Dryococelus australis]
MNVIENQEFFKLEFLQGRLFALCSIPLVVDMGPAEPGADEIEDNKGVVAQERPILRNSKDIPRMQEEVVTFSVNFQKQLDIIRKELQAVSNSV